MHELSLAVSIGRLLKEELRKHSGRELAGVKLSVGAFSCVHPDLLATSLRALCEEEGWQDVAVDVRREELRAVCNDCGCTFLPRPAEFRCTECASGNVELCMGTELEIESITLQ